MDKLHQKLHQDSVSYDNWHSRAYYRQAHWFSLVAVFFITLSVIASTWQATLEEQALTISKAIVRAQPACLVFEKVFVPGTAELGVFSTDKLCNDRRYKFTASGTYNWKADGLAKADAEYFTEDNWLTAKRFALNDGLDLLVDNSNVEWTWDNGNPEFNPSHSYEFAKDGAGQTAKLRVFDGPDGYTDNSGQLTVLIEDIGPADKPPPDEEPPPSDNCGDHTPDLNCDQVVGPADLASLLSDWSKVGQHRTDLQCDRVVNVMDFGIMMSWWSPNGGYPGTYWHPQCGDPPPGGDKEPGSYPRIGIFHFGKATADWYAKHDLVMSNNGAGTSREIKAINPETIVLPTKGWTARPDPDTYVIDRADFDEGNFYVFDSQGKTIGNKPRIDQSSFSRPASFGKYRGQTILEALPRAAAEFSDLSISDGVATDWFWDKPRPSGNDIDLDRNGVNDFGEHGAGWVNAKWQAGSEALLCNLRSLLDRAGQNKVSLINAGFQFFDFGWQCINGMVREWTSGPVNFDAFWRNEYQPLMEQTPKPRVSIIDGRADREDPWIKEKVDKIESRHHFQAMRYLLTMTLMGDAYFNFMIFETAKDSQNHRIHGWYDEYDVDLGQPTSEARELGSKPGVWARFFDNGAVIFNSAKNATAWPAGSPVSVNDRDLESLPGFNGPYQRFQGSQDLSHNDGASFDQVTLKGYSYVKGGRTKVVGDGIILVKQPQTVVADIIIDNVAASTSPGSSPAQLFGFDQDSSGGSDFWSAYHHGKSKRYSGTRYWHVAATAASGAGSIKSAHFTPTIRVPGPYDVYEWHGSLSGNLSDKTPYLITAPALERGSGCTAVGRQTGCQVDQTKKAGQWNYLGRYDLSSGTSQSVTILTQGVPASQLVLADAIKFVYVGN